MEGQLPYSMLLKGLPPGLVPWGVVFACMTLYVPNRIKNQLELTHGSCLQGYFHSSSKQGQGFTPLVASICW